ncbi:hypothetical protein TWF281_004610 [Arthrobotrys megalospora]
MFRCTPISAVWTIGNGNTDQICTARAVSYVIIAIGLAIDVAIFILPAILIVACTIERRPGHCWPKTYTTPTTPNKIALTERPSTPETVASVRFGADRRVSFA